MIINDDIQENNNYVPIDSTQLKKFGSYRSYNFLLSRQKAPNG